MKPAVFDYFRPDTLAEVHEALAAEGAEARVLAGGQTLLPMLSMRLARPKLIIDIMRVAGLGEIAVQGDAIRIGATVTQARLLALPDLARRQPLLAEALPWVGHAQTRSRGTICGSVAHADPSAEIPLVLVALGAELQLSKSRRRRRVAAEEFFTGLMSTARDDDELIESILVPLRRPGHGYAFREFGRRHGDFAIVACAAIANGDDVRLAIGGVADRPIASNLGNVDGSALDDALNAFAWELEARDDLHATARYRRELVRRLGAEAIVEARQRSRSQPEATEEGGIGAPVTRAPAASAGPSAPCSPKRLNGAARRTVSFELNGRAVSGEAEPRLLLTDFLRHKLGMTGTHVGCEHGVCGACTIEIDGVPARACLTLAVQADGCRLRTVEGLAPEPGKLSVIQEAFRRHHGLQCGFCTPGILMSLDTFLRAQPNVREAELREYLGGHLCRCTGYTPIIRAALDAAQRLRESANA